MHKQMLGSVQAAELGDLGSIPLAQFMGPLVGVGPTQSLQPLVQPAEYLVSAFGLVAAQDVLT